MRFTLIQNDFTFINMQHHCILYTQGLTANTFNNIYSYSNEVYTVNCMYNKQELTA